MNPLVRIGAVFKAATMVFARSTRTWWTMLGRTRFDYAREVGGGRGNAAVMACVNWFCRTFPEAPIRVSTVDAQGQLNPQPTHPLKLLLDTPNEFYSGELLWYATLTDWMADGNAYWLKERSGSGRVVQLWWIPQNLIEPKWPDNDSSVFISHYEYKPNDTPVRYDTGDIVHFRYGLDPENPRKGCSPLKALFREIFTDDEAANYTASMLRNVGVPPVIIQPKADKDGNLPKLKQEDADEVKARIREVTTGDRRGEAVVMRGSTEITTLGFNPQQMDVKALRRIPEERISAIFGTPAVVVGLGAGLDRSTFANFAEAREAAYESNVIPSQRLLAAELRTQLLPDFGDVQRLKIEFDLSEVRVLQADQNELHLRAREDLKSGLLTRNQALEMIGEEPDPTSDVLYVPIGVTPTPVDALLEQPAPTLALPPPAKMLRLPARKAASNAGDALQRLRARLQRSAERDVLRELHAQQNRVLARLSGGGKAAGDVPGPDELLPPEELARLRAVLEAIHQRSLEGVHAIAEDVLGITFDLDDPTVRQFLADAGVNIVGIHQTTLAAVREALIAGQAEGESVSELAARLRGLSAFDQARATLVARTELGQASNRAAVHSYRASGVVVGVEIMDGDYDEACKSMNGRRFSLDQAPSPLEHPACTRAFLPITDVSELEGAA